jgi:D-erythro-7,8-dihydroneopterin triphosphate epimerase
MAKKSRARTPKLSGERNARASGARKPAHSQSLDQIHIRDLLLRCIVGVFPEERRAKQDVMINITLYADLSAACRSDQLGDTVDYKGIKQAVIAEVESSECQLVEHLAERIARICLKEQRVLRVRVRLEKPGALRFARSVGVEIVRERPAQ